ncbi:hypothetical protein [Muricoccus nepalensis]|nr:hypothetical protein [Roseomonas nepalensis]
MPAEILFDNACALVGRDNAPTREVVFNARLHACESFSGLSATALDDRD